MNTKTLIWENRKDDTITIEIRVQLSTTIWRSELDGRYYTLGIIGWWDITDTIHLYPTNNPI